MKNLNKYNCLKNEFLLDLLNNKMSIDEIPIMEMHFIAKAFYEKGITSCCLLASLILYKLLKKMGYKCTIGIGY